MIYLVCYDIEDDRERNRVAKALLRHGRRVQYSVFELHRMSPAARRNLAAELAGIVSDPGSVRFYRMTLDGIEDSTDLAGNPLGQRPLLHVV
jgi:CRISPR-associated protein Cas2